MTQLNIPQPTATAGGTPDRLADAINRINELTADGDESTRLIGAKCRSLMRGYDAAWASADWECECVETMYHLPLVNPETSRESRTFTHAGKYDGKVRYRPSGKRYILEHKTTSDSIEDPNAPYWRILQIESQVSSYALAAWQEGDKVDGTLYDVIHKPTIRPKKITKAEQKEMIQHGKYAGFDVPKTYRLFEQECHELYELRLLRDCLDNPAKYFQRRPIPRLDSDLIEHANELWEIGQAILDARNKGRHFKNHRACFTYGSPCEYLPLCCGADDEDSDRWQKSESVHAELPLLDGDGRSVLTNSRVGMFQTCRKRHYYRYEVGLHRRDEEQREALFMGTVIHAALEVWWSHFSKG